MPTNPLLTLSNVADQVLAISRESYVGESSQISRLREALAAKEHESLEVASRRTAFEAQIVAESFLENAHGGAAKFIELEELLNLIWSIPEDVGNCLEGRAISLDSMSAAYLKMTAGYTERDGIYASSPEEIDYSWLLEILDEIDADLSNTSIQKQLRIGIERHISIMRSTLSRNVVPVDTVVQQLATLSGLLSAAAHTEPDTQKSKKFWRWSVRISAGLVADVLTGIPVNTATNLIMLALESSDDTSPESNDGDLEDLGESVGV